MGKFGFFCPWYPVRKGGPGAFLPFFVHGRFLPRREESLPRHSTQPERSAESHHLEVYTQTCLTQHSVAHRTLHFPGRISAMMPCTPLHIISVRISLWKCTPSSAIWDTLRHIALYTSPYVIDANLSGTGVWFKDRCPPYAFKAGKYVQREFKLCTTFRWNLNVHSRVSNEAGTSDTQPRKIPCDPNSN